MSIEWKALCMLQKCEIQCFVIFLVRFERSTREIFQQMPAVHQEAFVKAFAYLELPLIFKK